MKLLSLGCTVSVGSHCSQLSFLHRCVIVAFSPGTLEAAKDGVEKISVVKTLMDSQSDILTRLLAPKGRRQCCDER